MSGNVPHICICVCTFRRPEFLRRLLQALETQATGDRFGYSIVVVDNDATESARAVVAAQARSSRVNVAYHVEPRQGIALARNLAMARAGGDFVAMIDDDEFPSRDWLLHLFDTCQRFQVQGVLGPVEPHFDQPPPQWVLKGRFFDRSRHATGHALDWKETRSGNALLRRDLVTGAEPPFNPQFLTGEDRDFFRRKIEQGCRFVWCDEAVVFESVPPERWKRSFMLRRALFRGRSARLHPGSGAVEFAKSLVAIALYAAALPVLLILGHHWFMTYLVKLCDHVGKILGLVGITPIKDAYVTQ